MRAEQKTIGVGGVDINGRFWKIIGEDEERGYLEDKKGHRLPLKRNEFERFTVRKKRIKIRRMEK